MFKSIGFLVNVLLASAGVGFFLVMLGAVKLGSALLIGGALLAYLGFMLLVH